MPEVLNNLKKIHDVKKRTKYSLILSTKNIVLDPLILILTGISPSVYYTTFKQINQGKVRLLNELEDNFKGFNFDFF